MAGASRPMKYPYTFTSKIVQFPWKYYFTNNWPFRYFIYGSIITFPLILWIDRKVNSPAAIAAHRERLRIEAEKEREHGA
ncbi:hypothetical protein CHUAL_012278 [Chamberlinius hualienensis]